MNGASEKLNSCAAESTEAPAYEMLQLLQSDLPKLQEEFPHVYDTLWRYEELRQELTGMLENKEAELSQSIATGQELLRQLDLVVEDEEKRSIKRQRMLRQKLKKEVCSRKEREEAAHVDRLLEVDPHGSTHQGPSPSLLPSSPSTPDALGTLRPPSALISAVTLVPIVYSQVKEVWKHTQTIFTQYRTLKVEEDQNRQREEGSEKYSAALSLPPLLSSSSPSNLPPFPLSSSVEAYPADECVVSSPAHTASISDLSTWILHSTEMMQEFLSSMNSEISSLLIPMWLSILTHRRETNKRLKEAEAAAVNALQEKKKQQRLLHRMESEKNSLQARLDAVMRKIEEKRSGLLRKGYLISCDKTDETVIDPYVSGEGIRDSESAACRLKYESLKAELEATKRAHTDEIKKMDEIENIRVGNLEQRLQARGSELQLSSEALTAAQSREISHISRMRRLEAQVEEQEHERISLKEKLASAEAKLSDYRQLADSKQQELTNVMEDMMKRYQLQARGPRELNSADHKTQDRLTVLYKELEAENRRLQEEVVVLKKRLHQWSQVQEERETVQLVVTESTEEEKKKYELAFLELESCRRQASEDSQRIQLLQARVEDAETRLAHQSRLLENQSTELTQAAEREQHLRSTASQEKSALEKRVALFSDQASELSRALEAQAQQHREGVARITALLDQKTREASTLQKSVEELRQERQNLVLQLQRMVQQEKVAAELEASLKKRINDLDMKLKCAREESASASLASKELQVMLEERTAEYQRMIAEWNQDKSNSDEALLQVMHEKEKEVEQLRLELKEFRSRYLREQEKEVEVSPLPKYCSSVIAARHRSEEPSNASLPHPEYLDRSEAEANTHPASEKGEEDSLHHQDGHNNKMAECGVIASESCSGEVEQELRSTLHHVQKLYREKENELFQHLLSHQKLLHDFNSVKTEVCRLQASTTEAEAAAHRYKEEALQAKEKLAKEKDEYQQNLMLKDSALAQYSAIAESKRMEHQQWSQQHCAAIEVLLLSLQRLPEMLMKRVRGHIQDVISSIHAALLPSIQDNKSSPSFTFSTVIFGPVRESLEELCVSSLNELGAFVSTFSSLLGQQWELFMEEWEKEAQDFIQEKSKRREQGPIKEIRMFTGNHLVKKYLSEDVFSHLPPPFSSSTSGVHGTSSLPQDQMTFSHRFSAALEQFSVLLSSVQQQDSKIQAHGAEALCRVSSEVVDTSELKHLRDALALAEEREGESHRTISELRSQLTATRDELCQLSEALREAEALQEEKEKECMSALLALRESTNEMEMEQLRERQVGENRLLKVESNVQEFCKHFSADALRGQLTSLQRLLQSRSEQERLLKEEALALRRANESMARRLQQAETDRTTVRMQLHELLTSPSRSMSHSSLNDTVLALESPPKKILS